MDTALDHVTGRAIIVTAGGEIVSIEHLGPFFDAIVPRDAPSAESAAARWWDRAEHSGPIGSAHGGRSGV